MLSLLLTQFRQQYPQGSLTSDLVTIHDGLYVVRACAGAEGGILASGFGANTTLELAEDTATTRALERLGLAAPQATNRLPQEDVAPQPLPASPATLPGATRVLSANDSATVASGDLDQGQADQASSQVELPTAIASLEPDLEPQPHLFTPEPLTPEPPLPGVAPPSLQPTAAPNLPFPAPDLPLPALDDFADEFVTLGAGPVAPVDLSDIIAQTDVELQRLGWGVNQGREFLEKTYGKRSRHDLTDEELLEFLLYLETQPTPGSP